MAHKYLTEKEFNWILLTVEGENMLVSPFDEIKYFLI